MAVLELASAGAPVLALARRQPPPPPSSAAATDDTSDLVNSLLAGLLGFGEMEETDLVAEVAEVGRVSFKTPVRFEYMGREGLRRYVADLIEEEYPASEAEADGRTLVAFDLLPAGTDLRALRARVLEDNVVGFYDERPEKRRLYVVSEDKRLTPMNQLVLAHELRHALQDQYMGVHDLLDAEVSDYDDRQLALLSLLEGDATFVMEKFLLKRMPGGEDGMAALGQDSGVFGLGQMAAAAVPGAPPVVRDQLGAALLRGPGLRAGRLSAAGVRGHEGGLGPAARIDRASAPPGKVRGGRNASLCGPCVRPVREPGVAGGRAGRGPDPDLAGRRLRGGGRGVGRRRLPVLRRGWQYVLVWQTEWDTPSEMAEFLAAARKRLAGLATIEKAGWQVFARGEWRFALA